MEKFIFESYKKIDGSYVLINKNNFDNKKEAIADFKKEIKDYELKMSDVEKIDDVDDFIWRLKTKDLLFVLRCVLLGD